MHDRSQEAVMPWERSLWEAFTAQAAKKEFEEFKEFKERSREDKKNIGKTQRSQRQILKQEIAEQTSPRLCRPRETEDDPKGSLARAANFLPLLPPFPPVQNLCLTIGRSLDTI
jgi:hypothetical protein